MKSEEVTANVQIDGSAMRELRKLAGFSIKSLASKVQCSRPYISMRKTRPDRTCSPELFARICDVLGVKDRSVLLRKASSAPSEAA